MGRQDGFRHPAGKHVPEIKRRDANNRQTAHGRTHHKLLWFIARVKYREQRRHDKVGAGQPVPHQRAKGADKQAERLMIVPPPQMLRNLRFVFKDQASAQMVMQSMIATLAIAPT